MVCLCLKHYESKNDICSALPFPWFSEKGKLAIMFCLLPIAFASVHSVYNNFPSNEMLIGDNNFAIGLEEKKIVHNKRIILATSTTLVPQR